MALFAAPTESDKKITSMVHCGGPGSFALNIWPAPKCGASLQRCPCFSVAPSPKSGLENSLADPQPDNRGYVQEPKATIAFGTDWSSDFCAKRLAPCKDALFRKPLWRWTETTFPYMMTATVYGTASPCDPKTITAVVRPQTICQWSIQEVSPPLARAMSSHGRQSREVAACCLGERVAVAWPLSRLICFCPTNSASVCPILWRTCPWLRGISPRKVSTGDWVSFRCFP